MKIRDITIGLVGAGGDGVVAAGDVLATSVASEGLYCMQVKSFGPQIRGGESSCRVRISDSPVLSQGDLLDVLISFSWKEYVKFDGELDVREGVTVLMEEDEEIEDSKLPLKNVSKYDVIRVPFNKLTKETGNPLAKNIITLGVVSEMFGLPKDGIKNSIKKRFKKKGDAVIAANVGAFELGADWVRKNNKISEIQFEFKKGEQKLLLTGNDAVAFGALNAGCRFFASYPITPASEVMEWLSRELPKFDGTVVQAEDEISAVCMVTGASFGGVRSMTATSGPGVSLKLETIGMGSMMELPYVVVNVQRGGPSTGVPTKSEQSDLSQAIGGAHGDAPHAVIAPADVKDCYDATIRAFDVADRYQMPVILLSDQFLGHRKETVDGLELVHEQNRSILIAKDPKEGEYKRFVNTTDGVSPITFPGMKGGEYLASGIEHDEAGAPVSSHDLHEMMSAKRARKMERLAKDYKFIRRYGSKDPDVGIIAWGSTKGVVKEAVERAETHGMKVAGLVPQLIYPLQTEEVNDFLKGLKALVIVEMSFSGQFRQYLAGQCRLPENVQHLHITGCRAFCVDEIIELVKKANNR